MKIVKVLFKCLCLFLMLPLLYFAWAYTTMSITVDDKEEFAEKTKAVYLKTNGVHLDVVIDQSDLSIKLTHSLIHFDNEQYLAFGWGDENFYLNTPTWADLTFEHACKAMFLTSTTLMHVTRHENKEDHWVKVPVTSKQLNALNDYILHSFQRGAENEKRYLPNESYSIKDDFYKAKGSYSLFKTCNSWVNAGFVYSGIRACYWTPFDFGLINKHKI